jgi:uncharacterized membrane protein YeaQ/YmgE (transglycosylase-associated protein family)
VLALTAYETGRVIGQIVVLGIVAAVVGNALSGRLRARFPRSVRIVLAAVVAGAIVLVSVNSVGDKDPGKVRAEMVAGCEAGSAGGTGICGCLVDEVLKRNGTTADDLARLEDEFRAVQENGAPMPAGASRRWA